MELELEEGARLLEEAADAGRPGRPGPGPTAIDRCATPRPPPSRACRGPSTRPSCRSSTSCPTPPTWPLAAAPLWVDRERALVGAWYELFPRSYANPEQGKSGLAGATDRLPAVANMGFDVVYVPPVHPIGRSFRKGRNNSLDPGPRRPGQPLGHRRPGSPEKEGAATWRCTPNWAASPTSTPSWPGPGAWAWRWRSTTPSSAPPSIPG